MGTKIIVYTLLLCIAVCQATHHNNPPPKTTRVVVTFHTWEQARGGYNVGDFTQIRQYGRRLILDLGREVDLATDGPMLAKMIGEDVVKIVEEDEIMQIASLPIDIDWHLIDSEPYGIHVEKIWSFTNSSPDIIVAVVDSGIASSAIGAFLNINVSDGYDFVSVAKSNDGDGRDPDPTELMGNATCESIFHGTSVASTIAASHNMTKGLGIRGVAQNVTIVPVKVTGCNGTGYSTDIADGILYAGGGTLDGVKSISKPAKIISVSIAGIASCADFYQSAISEVIQRGSIVVAAAGNNNKPGGTVYTVYNARPANCVGTLTVGATGRNGNMAYYSNRLAKLTAPGGEYEVPIRVLGITDQGSLVASYAQGTSYATPIVSGALALVLSLCPNINTISQFVNIFNVRNLSSEIALDMRILFTDGECSGIKNTCPLYKQQTSISNCTSCSDGNGYRQRCLAWNSATCEQCSAGKYFAQNATGSKCISCPIGKFSNTTGATSCRTCLPGTYTSKIKMSTCYECMYCPAGTYTVCTNTDYGSCFYCPIGTYSGTDSLKIYGCTPCPQGKYADTIGSAACLPCLQGTYANTTGSSACLPCQNCTTNGYYNSGCNSTYAGTCAQCTNAL